MSFTTINGKPVEVKPNSGSEATSLPTNQTHQAQCGNVGATGEHGAIGSNAKDSQAK